MALVVETTQRERPRIGRPPGSGPVKRDMVELFVSDYGKGLSIRQIMHLRDYAYSTVRRHLVLEGVPMRKRGGRAGRAAGL